MAAKISDPWSPYERKIKYLIEIIKTYILYPLVWPLLKLGVTANMVSFFSAVLGVISAVYVFIDLRISVLFLVLSFIFDGLDGTVARETKTNNAQGSVTDCFFDQIVIISTTMAYAGIGIMNPLIAVLYSSLYPILIIFTVIRNRLNIPNGYVFRPRTIIYLFFLIYVFTSFNFLNESALICSLVMAIYIIRDFFRLREEA